MALNTILAHGKPFSLFLIYVCRQMAGLFGITILLTKTKEKIYIGKARV